MSCKFQQDYELSSSHNITTALRKDLTLRINCQAVRQLLQQTNTNTLWRRMLGARHKLKCHVNWEQPFGLRIRSVTEPQCCQHVLSGFMKQQMHSLDGTCTTSYFAQFYQHYCTDEISLANDKTDQPAKNLEQFANAVELLSLVDKSTTTQNTHKHCR